MAHTKSGSLIGAARHMELVEQREYIASIGQEPTPDYAGIVVSTFGREFSRTLYMSGWDYFKRVSLWLSRLDDQERESASIMVGMGNDLDKVMQAIESDRMTREVMETQYSL